MSVRYAITAPDEGRAGRLLGADFTDGRAPLDDPPPGVLLWFRRHGFTVEADDGPPPATPNAPNAPPEPAGRSRSRSKTAKEG
ncbi:hypothetical protein OG883_31175 [Streptomyces sp. NBC_01142]|uniref:hypothetical protein n=1 Tax=Streptomyces sp. NBC_01142 TaxID=2975865 RepID=UPI00224FF382|nr:hypothetical protein [Streptomyces sp. NBC_01142]MCX4824242.1 hypothetical protein [Streptomyces sp. NBC_01142]